MGLGKDTLAEEGAHRRYPHLLDELADLLGCARDSRAVPDQEDGPLGGLEGLGGRRHRLGVPLARHRVAWEMEGLGLGIEKDLARYVLGHIDQNGARPAGAREVKGLAHHARDVLDVLDQVGVLHAGIGDARDIGLLEGVQAQNEGRALSADDDERNRVHERRKQPRDRVGRAGARGDEGDADLPRCPCIAVGHMDRTLLVPGEDELDLPAHESVIDGDYIASGEAVDELDPFFDHDLDEGFRSGQ